MNPETPSQPGETPLPVPPLVPTSPEPVQPVITPQVPPPPPKSKKKLFRIIGTLFVLIIVVGSVIFFYTILPFNPFYLLSGGPRTSNVPSPTPETMDDETADWETYIGNGFKISYPKTIGIYPTVSARPLGDLINLQGSGVDYTYTLLSFSWADLGGKDVKTFMDEHYPDYSGVTQVDLAGTDASRYFYTQGIEQDIVVLPVGQRALIITILKEGVNAGYSEIFDQILSTFEFIDSDKAIIEGNGVVAIKFERCSRQRHTVYVGFGSTTIEVAGKDGQNCNLNYGGEIENPNWDGKLTTHCQVPINLGTLTFDTSNYGVDFSAIEKYCSS